MLIRDRSGPRKSYFERVQNALQKAGFWQPTIVIDRKRLHHNITKVTGDLGKGLSLRIVAKSLPIPQLLEEASSILRSQKFMTFNVDMLQQLTSLKPEADQLLGKPLPVGAAEIFYAKTKIGHRTQKVTWLIDSPKRLHEYAALANKISVSLDVALELDVGLHRGGLVPNNELSQMLLFIKNHTGLRFSGFMGYEAHVSKVPAAFGLRKRAFANSQKIYQRALKLAGSTLELNPMSLTIRNTGGSTTFSLYGDSKIANEVAVGSALLKPTDFDTNLLDAYVPALYIGTPVLKANGSMKTPFLEKLDSIKNLVNPNLAQTIFIHGGYWKAQPEDPPGMFYNKTYGRSSNQEILTVGRNCALQPDDYVFFRPTQTESVLMQFGEVAIYEDGQIIDSWKPFPTSV